MKKILKDVNYLTIIGGVLIGLIFMITYFFIKSRIYFSITFAFDIIINFIIMGFLLLNKSKWSTSLRFKNISVYLLITLFLLCLDITIINNFWDMNIYNNLMYVSNIKLYLGIYAFFVIMVSLLSIYIIIKYDFIEGKK